MLVIILVLASLGVAAFIMVTDTRRNDSIRRLEQRSSDGIVADGGSDSGDAGHGSGHGSGQGSGDGGGDGGGGSD